MSIGAHATYPPAFCSHPRPPSSHPRQPRTILTFLEPPAFFSSPICLNLAHDCTRSTMPHLVTAFMNLADSGAVEPKALDRVVSVSLVWESNAGFSMRQFTNNARWFFTWNGLMVTPLFFLLASFVTSAVIWSAM